MSDLLVNPRFPRSSRYERDWIVENQMGPNALWLMEWLCNDMALEPGMRVLDMGCGRAMSSIFLAREFGVKVWANDLWISATDNWARVVEQGLQDQICPIHAEANALPYADGFFDAAVSVDAYHYFGVDPAYSTKFARLVRPGGRIGIGVPGRMAEFPDGPPEALRDWLATEEGAWELFQTPAFWRRHFEQVPGTKVVLADSLEDGWKDWIEFSQMTLGAGTVPEELRKAARAELEAIRADAGNGMGFVRVIADRTDDA